jgi:predicted TIM-barrel fold metal-dependent hydrolase
VRLGQTGLDDAFKAQVRLDKRYWRGIPVSQYLRKMDRAGIERSLLIAVRAGDLNVRGSFELPIDRVAAVCARWPDRFSGLAGVDPFRGMKGLADLTYAVKQCGFVGAHLYPHWFGLAPDHAKYYPYYAKCAELGVPIMMQVGHNLVYTRERRLPSVGRPITLDQVAIDFPELTLIGIHIGVPWTDEMISMCWKHPNVYTAGDAYAPRHWPASYVHYLNTYGRDKVLFGTDWPVIDPERAVREVKELGLRPESERALMRDNALRIFKLPGYKRVRSKKP